jgi:hypothetical protein
MGISLGLKSVHQERRLMKWGLGIGLGLMTFALAFVNGTGAWVSTNSLAFTALAVGAEIALVFMFSLVVLSETRLRQIVGGAIFCGLAWFCVENGKAGIRHWMEDSFAGTPSALRAEADLLEAEALRLDTLPDDTREEATEDRRALRDEMAALRAELELMNSETRISEAQRHLTSLGLYTGRIDGIRAELTESAMRQRGEAVRRRMEILQFRLDDAGTTSAVEGALAPAQDRRLKAIELRTQADEVVRREWWAQILLVVAEAARSFGVWAFLMAGTRKTARVNVEAPGEGQMSEDERKAVDKVLEGLTQREEGDTRMTRREVAKKGGDASALARKSRGIDGRIPIDPPEVAA